MFFLLFSICWVDSQEMALPVTSWCLNIVLNFVTKSAKVPRENVVPEMALWRKVAAQVRADPLVMYERAKVICLSSLSYIDRFIDKEVKLHGVQPVLRFFIGSIERFGGADA